MFSLSIENADGAADVLQDMLNKINHFKAVDIGEVMSNWQTADMHRHRPFTMRARRAGRATTIVRPHSRYEVIRSERTQRRIARRIKKGLPNLTPFQVHTSMRPILREELIDTLSQRLNDAASEKLVWKHATRPPSGP